jgi:UDP-glucose 4-epimerase
MMCPSRSYKLKSSTNFMGKRVVVIGKRGFVGGAVVQELYSRGMNILEIGREDLKNATHSANNFFVDKLKDGDTVIYAAADAPVKSTDQFISNLKSFDYFIEAAKEFQLSQLIYVSSDAVYLDSRNRLTEDSLRAPDSLHGLMHLTRETILTRSDLRDALCIVRPTLIYGARDPHNGYGPNSFMRLAKSGEDIVLFGNGEELRDFIHISDVAHTIVELVLMNFHGVLNIATGEECSFKDVANFTLETLGIDRQVKSTLRRGPIPHGGFRAFDVKNLHTLLPNWKPKSIRHGLQLMHQGF